ncbi:unnamed protein product [Euphydryas editha]|uniref:Histone-lysine N-methyltransferase SETMAR n=1 Tax=Euphydryas editha TaxID=104508 RepID=A0AAU9TJU5_EUPED|nr:unnamed protein product [Euphydryas editha]
MVRGMPEELGVSFHVVFDDFKPAGVIHYNFLQLDQTITTESFCEEIDKKKPKIASAAGTGQHMRSDPAPRQRQSVNSQNTVRKLNELSVKVLLHPPYSLDLSSNDYHLFKDFDNFLTSGTFANQDLAKTAAIDFIESRTPNFYGDIMNRLVLRWQK